VNRTPDEILDDLVSGVMQPGPQELNGILREVWLQMHGPLHRCNQAVLLALFRHAGYVCDSVAYPPADLSIYCGEPVAGHLADG
jgi:hypothetical protein